MSQPQQTTPVRYTWKGHLLEASEEAREEKTIVLGGDVTLLNAEFIEEGDGTLSLNLVSNGPQSRAALSRLVNLLQSVVTQDAIDAHEEQRQQADE